MAVMVTMVTKISMLGWACLSLSLSLSPRVLTLEEMVGFG
jgi:hypothetical protein